MEMCIWSQQRGAFPRKVEGAIILCSSTASPRLAFVLRENPFTPLTATQRRAFTAAARHYGEFLGMPAALP